MNFRCSPTLRIANFAVSSLVALSAALWLSAGAAAKPLPVAHFPLPPGASTNSLAPGPDGSLWFDSYAFEGAPQIGRLAGNGEIETFDIPGVQGAQRSPSYWPTIGSITTASDNLWFTLYGGAGGEIGRMTSAGKVDRFALPRSASSFPEAIASGPDGRLWFTSNGPGSVGALIGVIDDRGRIAEFPLPRNQFVHAGITAGPDGNVWFLAEGSINRYPHRALIGRITPKGKITEIRVHGELVSAIAAADGAIWFAGEYAIGRISANGRVATYPLLAPDSATPEVDTLATAPNGDLWFTANPPTTLGRITPSGAISYAPMSSDNDTHSSLISHDGYLWFNERKDIARVKPRLIGPRLSQIVPIGPNAPGSFRITCRQRRQSCSGTLRIQIQPWTRGGPEPERLLGVSYHLERGASRSFRLPLGVEDLRRVRMSLLGGVPVTIGAYEHGGYATDLPIELSK